MTVEIDVELIKQRNAKVETDKAWETSNVRKLSIIVVTYVVATLVMWSIGVERPHVNAIIPTMGFFLSTLSLGFVKTYWIQKFYNKG